MNHETDLFEARLEMLAGLVDVYLVLEVGPPLDMLSRNVEKQ